MEKLAIVAIGYNRIACLLRLLRSLDDANYEESVPLIISLDNCGTNDLLDAVNAFEWHHGEKIVVHQKERLGLKKHVLSIGEWTKKYQNIVVFEDDLIVSPYYMDFVNACIEKYGEDDRIAGIGLYNQNLNQEKCYYFEPVNDGYDAYFMQYACSWGQVWSTEKWKAFMEWYQNNDEPFNDDPSVPVNVNRWNEKSWLKYHVKYCAVTGKYFVYPRISLTTNFSSVGSHSKFEDNSYQIPLLFGRKKWNLPSLDQSNALYDAYYENLKLGDAIGIKNEDICIDTYGVHKTSEGKRYWLTTKVCGYKVVQSYALELRPRDANILLNVKGNIIKLYDTSVKDSLKASAEKLVDQAEIHYIVKSTSLKQLMKYNVRTVLARLKDKLKR